MTALEFFLRVRDNCILEATKKSKVDILNVLKISIEGTRRVLIGGIFSVNLAYWDVCF